MSDQLREMTHYRGVMALIIKIAKKQGIRFDVSDFSANDIEYMNQDVVVFGGKACKLIERLFQPVERSLPGK